VTNQYKLLCVFMFSLISPMLPNPIKEYYLLKPLLARLLRFKVIMINWSLSMTIREDSVFWGVQCLSSLT